MNDPAYSAARAVASKVHEHFAHHAQTSAAGAARTSAGVGPDVIEAVIDAAFWASLRREEHYVPRVSIAIMAPEDAVQPLVFEHPLSLNAGSLVHVSAAVERPGLHLAVWRFGEQLCVWSTVRAVPTWCCVVEVAAPGLLVIKHRPSDLSGKFVNLAVLEGDQIKIIDERARMASDCPAVVGSLLGSDALALDSTNVFIELAVSMRAHARGGSLLVVPEGADVWRESIVHPIPYSISPRFGELADLMRDPPHERPGSWDVSYRRVIDTIAGLTAVDGATVLTDHYALVAFGAKISRRDGFARAEQVAVSEPIEGARTEIVHPGQIGGTRHLSAVQFVQDQHDALALVASQDGRFTVFSWSSCDAMVRADRIESLLL